MWFAHICCCCCVLLFVLNSETFAPLGRYLHHYPHFDKAHDYHVPGFNATLALYKEVRSSLLYCDYSIYISICYYQALIFVLRRTGYRCPQVFDAAPEGGVWGVLGEGGGGGGCGGGCSGGRCGHGGGGGGVRRKIPPLLPDYSVIWAGAGCGAGIFKASCGAGNDGRPPLRIIDEKPEVATLVDGPRRKIICDVNIIAACLNLRDLSEASVSPYGVLAPNVSTYM